MTEPELDRGVSSGIRRDTLLVTVCTLVSRVSGFGRVVATAAVLGVGVLGDVYQTANMIPNLLFELVAGGVLQAVLLPAFVAARREGGNDALGDATQATNGVIVAGLTAAAAVGLITAPLVARLLVLAEPSAALAAEKLDVMVPMVLVFIPQLVCYGVAAAAGAALNAKGRFVAAALAPAVNNVVVILACVAFRAARGDVVADLNLTVGQFAIIAGGTTLGVVLLSLTPALALRRAGVRWWPRWRPQHPAVQDLRHSFGWATLSIVGTLVPTAMALALGNGAPGGVAVFVFAFAFYVLPHALVAVTTATTLAPRVADAWQAGEIADLRATVDRSMLVAMRLLVLAGSAMVALAWPVTRLVAGIGQTSSQGLAPIAHTLAAFGPGLLGYGVAFVMMRVLFALGDVRRASILMIAAAFAGVATMVVASGVASPHNRAAALAVGYGVAQTVAAILLTMRVHRLTGAMAPLAAVRHVVEAVLAGAVAVAVMRWIVERFDTSQRAAASAVVLGGLAGMAAFAAALGLLSRRELGGGRRR